MGKFLSFSHTHIFRVFAISTFDVYAHSLIGSVHDPYASFSIFCFCPRPPHSFTHLIPANFTPVFLCLYPRISVFYSGGLLLASSFLSEDHQSSPLSATSCDKNGAIDLSESLEIRTMYQAQYSLYVYIHWHYVYTLGIVPSV
jgi:hypothetical protein